MPPANRVLYDVLCVALSAAEICSRAAVIQMEQTIGPRAIKRDWYGNEIPRSAVEWHAESVRRPITRQHNGTEAPKELPEDQIRTSPVLAGPSLSSRAPHPVPMQPPSPFLPPLPTPSPVTHELALRKSSATLLEPRQTIPKPPTRPLPLPQLVTNEDESVRYYTCSSQEDHRTDAHGTTSGADRSEVIKSPIFGSWQAVPLRMYVSYDQSSRNAR